MKDECFRAAIYRLSAKLVCDCREGRIEKEAAISEMRAARKELLRAIASIERLLFLNDSSFRLANHPRLTIEQCKKLADAGWFPFPELTEAENDEIFIARLSGFGLCSAAYPDAETQARRTLANARKHNKGHLNS